MKKIIQRIIVGVVIALIMWFVRSNLKSITPQEWVEGTGNVITHRQEYFCNETIGNIFYTFDKDVYIIASDFKLDSGVRSEWFGGAILNIIPVDLFPMEGYFIPVGFIDFPELGCTTGQIEEFSIVRGVNTGENDKETLYLIVGIAIVGYIISRFWRRLS